jgi:oligopeptide/dipeptide ABC transporter ATP-binding protein
MAASLLKVENLSVSFDTLHGRVQVLDGVSFDVGQGEIVGLIGESGSGKSVSAFSVMQLLGEQGRIDSGSITFDGTDLSHLSTTEISKVRGKDVSMIFQEPMTSLNPVFTVGSQIAEVLTTHLGLGRKEAHSRAVELLTEVGIPTAEARINEYPHQLSGGMRQRVMIAMALACRPKLLIADEPTTALDVTIQAQILDLLGKLCSESNLAILLITHDFGVIAEIAQRVIVMYAGQVVEVANVDDIFSNPLHPYTKQLMKSIPKIVERCKVLPVIPGSAPAPTNFPSGCRFHDRCPDATDRCSTDKQQLRSVQSSRVARCWRVDPQ